MSEEDKDELVHIEVGEEELFADICRVVSDYRRQMEASQSLTYTKPEKAANALYRWSTGWSPTKIRKKLGVQPVSLRNMLVDFAIHADKWQELGAKISSRSMSGRPPAAIHSTHPCVRYWSRPGGSRGS